MTSFEISGKKVLSAGRQKEFLKSRSMSSYSLSWLVYMAYHNYKAISTTGQKKRAYIKDEKGSLIRIKFDSLQKMLSFNYIAMEQSLGEKGNIEYLCCSAAYDILFRLYKYSSRCKLCDKYAMKEKSLGRTRGLSFYCLACSNCDKVMGTWATNSKRPKEASKKERSREWTRTITAAMDANYGAVPIPMPEPPTAARRTGRVRITTPMSDTSDFTTIPTPITIDDIEATEA